jgi:hypothetical protein
MTDLALERDQTTPRKSSVRRHGRTADAARQPAQAGDQPDQLQGTRDVLISAIPTEVLAPYTGLIAIIVSTIEGGDDKMLVLRWAIYAVGIVAIAAWIGSGYLHQSAAQKRRRFPVLETITAAVAFAAWGLVMPGSPLSADLSGSALTVWTAVITAGGGLLVTILAGPLTKQAKTGNQPAARRHD